MPHSAPGLDIERRLLAEGSVDIVIAIDEVGRGALAGPVTLGAVAIDAHIVDAPPGVRDSKTLTAKQREALAPVVRRWVLASEVVDVPASRIDEVGIVRALGEGAAMASQIVAQTCSAQEAIVLLDGSHDFVSAVDPTRPVHTVVKGDAICASIAAASILAKVHRDAVMRELHREFPAYGWDRNVGYGTKVHREALRVAGVTSQHRRSWRLFEPTISDSYVGGRNSDV